jgi:hypothetical protein
LVIRSVAHDSCNVLCTTPLMHFELHCEGVSVVSHCMARSDSAGPAARVDRDHHRVFWARSAQHVAGAHRYSALVAELEEVFYREQSLVEDEGLTLLSLR